MMNEKDIDEVLQKPCECLFLCDVVELDLKGVKGESLANGLVKQV